MTHFTPTQSTAATTRHAVQAARTATPRGDHPVMLPRRQRIGSALGSVLVTTVLVGSVVFGMGSMADDAVQMAGQSATTTRA